MIKYPNSICEAHRDVETSEPVCIICMDYELTALRAEVEGLRSNLDSSDATVKRLHDRLLLFQGEPTYEVLLASYAIAYARVAELEAALGEAIKDLEKLGSDSHPGNEYRNGWMNYANESAAAARPALRGEVGNGK